VESIPGPSAPGIEELFVVTFEQGLLSDDGSVILPTTDYVCPTKWGLDAIATCTHIHVSVASLCLDRWIKKWNPRCECVRRSLACTSLHSNEKKLAKSAMRMRMRMQV
jgi:hypothetical protein